MSTRCQVQIKSQGLSFGDTELISLYHHCDGYPTNILPLIRKARKHKLKYAGSEYIFGRPGHAAGLLCSVDPEQFEPESSAELHGDIEWLYLIECRNTAGGSMSEKPVWYVKVYRPGTELANSTLVAEGDILTLSRRAKSIEKKGESL